MSFTVGFWAIRYGDQVGFQFSAITYACVSVLFFLPVLWVMMCVAILDLSSSYLDSSYSYGERLRARLGEPSFNKEI
jgi:hypothetical protein